MDANEKRIFEMINAAWPKRETGIEEGTTAAVKPLLILSMVDDAIQKAIRKEQSKNVRAMSDIEKLAKDIQAEMYKEMNK